MLSPKYPYFIGFDWGGGGKTLDNFFFFWCIVWIILKFKRVYKKICNLLHLHNVNDNRIIEEINSCVLLLF